MDTLELPTSAAGSATSVAPRRFWLFTILAGALAGLLAFFVGEAILQAYQSHSSMARKLRPTPDDVRKQTLVMIACASATYASLGGLLGMTLGLAGGLIRRSSRGAILGAVFGLALGGGFGGAMTRVVAPIYYQRQNVDANDLFLPFLTHGVIWSSLGAAAGFAFGFGLGSDRWRSTLAGGLAGAALATLLYEVVGAIAFPAARTDLPLSMTATTRAMAHFSVALIVAASVALAVRPTRPPSAHTS